LRHVSREEMGRSVYCSIGVCLVNRVSTLHIYGAYSLTSHRVMGSTKIGFYSAISKMYKRVQSTFDLVVALANDLLTAEGGESRCGGTAETTLNGAQPRILIALPKDSSYGRCIGKVRTWEHAPEERS
jgi:hypothetical protein